VQPPPPPGGVGWAKTSEHRNNSEAKRTPTAFIKVLIVFSEPFPVENSLLKKLRRNRRIRQQQFFRQVVRVKIEKPFTMAKVLSRNDSA